MAFLQTESSTFVQVLEPIDQKPGQENAVSLSAVRIRRCRYSSKILTSFYLPTACFGINMFKQYFAILAAKGFELISLDKSSPLPYQI